MRHAVSKPIQEPVNNVSEYNETEQGKAQCRPALGAGSFSAAPIPSQVRGTEPSPLPMQNKMLCHCREQTKAGRSQRGPRIDAQSADGKGSRTAGHAARQS